MPHEVFVAYSPKDKPAADALVRHLESGGIACWYAPRDIPPGQNFAEAIRDAIRRSRAMLVLLTPDSMLSAFIQRQVQVAVVSNLAVLPVRSGDASPSEALQYLLGTSHWLAVPSLTDESAKNSIAAALQDLLSPMVSPADIAAKKTDLPEPAALREQPIVPSLPAAKQPASGWWQRLTKRLFHHDSDPSAASVQATSDHDTRGVFISYGRADAQALAERLCADLSADGYRVWLDKKQIRAGHSWEEQIERAVLATDIFVCLLTPHAVRRPDGVCLDEISMARYHGKRIIPAMVIQCRPPLGIYRLDYVDLHDWNTKAGYDRGYGRIRAALSLSEGGVEGLSARLFASLKPLDFGAELARLTRNFTGRLWLDEAVTRWLAEPTSRVFFLIGDPGSGKSSYLAHLVSQHAQVAAYHFCQATLADSVDPDRFVASIAAQLATQFPAYRESLNGIALGKSEGDPISRFRRLVADPLRSEKFDRPILIVVDALDEAHTAVAASIPHVLRAALDDLPMNVRIVMSSRREAAILDMFSRFQPYEIEASSANNRTDLAAFLTRSLASVPAVAALPAKRLARLREAIIDRSGGNFLYVAQFVLALEDGRIDAADPASFPAGLVGVYQSFLNRLFPQGAGFEACSEILTVILAALRPLTVAELSQALSVDPIRIAKVMQPLSSFFPLRNGCYQPFHKSISDYLSGGIGHDRTFSVSPERGHRILAAFCMRELGRLRMARGTASTIRPYAANAADHFAALQDWESYIETMEDDFYFALCFGSATINGTDIDEKAVAAVPASAAAMPRQWQIGLAVMLANRFARAARTRVQDFQLDSFPDDGLADPQRRRVNTLRRTDPVAAAALGDACYNFIFLCAQFLLCVELTIRLSGSDRSRAAGLLDTNHDLMHVVKNLSMQNSTGFSAKLEDQALSVLERLDAITAASPH